MKKKKKKKKKKTHNLFIVVPLAAFNIFALENEKK